MSSSATKSIMRTEKKAKVKSFEKICLSPEINKIKNFKKVKSFEEICFSPEINKIKNLKINLYTL
jgi:hypothetical protein